MLNMVAYNIDIKSNISVIPIIILIIKQITNVQHNNTQWFARFSATANDT